MNHWGPFEDWATATMDVTYTQANAAGGAVVCEITPNRGNEFVILAVRQINSGTNSCNMAIETATNGTQILNLGTVASGAGTTEYLSIGVVESTFTSGVATGLGYPVIVSGTQTLKIFQGGAGAQNDTMRVLVNVRCSGPSVPNVIHSNSTNPANVSVSAGAENFTVIG